MRKNSKKAPPPLPPLPAPSPEEALAEAREYAAGALRALGTWGHEDVAAEMLHRAARAVDAARRDLFRDEALAPEVEVVAAIDLALSEVA